VPDAIVDASDTRGAALLDELDDSLRETLKQVANVSTIEVTYPFTFSDP
jgi:hypothetical protein